MKQPSEEVSTMTQKAMRGFWMCGVRVRMTERNEKLRRAKDIHQQNPANPPYCDTSGFLNIFAELSEVIIIQLQCFDSIRQETKQLAH
jgi:hypothetical protein